MHAYISDFNRISDLRKLISKLNTKLSVREKYYGLWSCLTHWQITPRENILAYSYYSRFLLSLKKMRISYKQLLDTTVIPATRSRQNHLDHRLSLTYRVHPSCKRSRSHHCVQCSWKLTCFLVSIARWTSSPGMETSLADTAWCPGTSHPSFRWASPPEPSGVPRAFVSHHDHPCTAGPAVVKRSGVGDPCTTSMTYCSSASSLVCFSWLWSLS